MECKNLGDHSGRVKISGKSNFKNGQHEGKTITFQSNSSISLSTTANNTNPVICAVCGSKELVTLHSQERNYGFGTSIGWNPAESLKNVFLNELGHAYGPFNPLAQSMLPHLSFFHIPNNILYSHFNSNLKFASNTCIPIDRYFGDSIRDGSRTRSTNSESTLCRESKQPGTKKSNPKLRREAPFRKDEPNFYKNRESWPGSSYGNIPEVRNYPFPMQPWMGNLCPFFPYGYASLALPVNHPLIPVYYPLPARWQNSERQNDEVPDNSTSDSPPGDCNSVKNDCEKKSDSNREDNNTSEYDFEELARELLLKQKSNYDEDGDDFNIDEITNDLKLPDDNSGREINTEKFFTSKEKWSRESCKDCNPENDEIPNWRVSSEINMQDCCIRTMSNENLWYEGEEGEKKDWDIESETKDFNTDTKHSKHKKETESQVKSENNIKITDGLSSVSCRIRSQDRNEIQNESDTKNRINWKPGSAKTTRRSKIVFGGNEVSQSDEKHYEWCDASKTGFKKEMEFEEEKINCLSDSARLRKLKLIKDQPSKSDVRFNDSTEDTESDIHAGRMNVECKSVELFPTPSSLNNGLPTKIKRDEKSKIYEYKIPISNNRKSKKQDDFKKRWLS